MSLFDNLKSRIIAHSDLDEIEVWLDRVPSDHEFTYPRIRMQMLNTSGRLENTFDDTSYENADIRFYVDDAGDADIHTYKSAIESLFSKGGFDLTSGRVGMCERTGSYVFYAGKDDRRNEIYRAVVNVRLTIQNS